jgi:capsular exopolysaccharide synthesis family protein
MATAAADGPAAEAYRALRGAFRHGTVGKVIAITSALGDEGRSTVAAQLACALARAGERVLLVDGDMRAPDLHRWFGGEVGPGLAEVLAAGDGNGTRATDLEDLFLLPAGQAGHHPGDLVARPSAARALAGLGDGFDRVIIDTPAVLTGSDASALAAAANGAMLVVRENRSGETEVAQAALRLRQAGAHIMGAVLVGGSVARH